MTPKELKRTMEFIVEQQAKFAADIYKLFESDDRLRESQATLTASVVNIAEILRESVRIGEERFTRLDDRLMRLAEAGRVADERMSALAEAQKATDDRLNTLINVMERHITGPEHGSQPQ